MDEKDLVGDLQGFVAVRREDYGMAFRRELLEVGTEALRVQRIETGKRFVEKDQAGSAHQLGRNGDASAFSAGQVRDLLVVESRKAQKFEKP